MQKIESRDSAGASGKSRYFSGVPCKRDHPGWRYVSTNCCIDCARLQSKGTNDAERFKKKSRNLETFAKQSNRWAAINVIVERELENTIHNLISMVRGGRSGIDKFIELHEEDKPLVMALINVLNKKRESI